MYKCSYHSGLETCFRLLTLVKSGLVSTNVHGKKVAGMYSTWIIDCILKLSIFKTWISHRSREKIQELNRPA